MKRAIRIFLFLFFIMLFFQNCRKDEIPEIIEATEVDYRLKYCGSFDFVIIIEERYDLDPQSTFSNYKSNGEVSILEESDVSVSYWQNLDDQEKDKMISIKLGLADLVTRIDTSGNLSGFSGSGHFSSNANTVRIYWDTGLGGAGGEVTYDVTGIR